MQRETNDDAPNFVSRRLVMTGALTGAALVASESAWAQACPSPPHVAVPIVWRDMDQKELDDAYDQSVYAFNAKFISERRRANNEIVEKIIGPPLRVAYGPTEIEKVDIYKTKKPNAPVFLFIHGGAWKGGRSSQCLSMAEPFINAGAHFVAVDFINVLQAHGDLFPMIDQVRRAVAWTYNNAASFGGDPSRFYIGGHSSGGHLGGCVMSTDWQAQGLPRDMIKGALLGSGMYDLHPVRLSKRSQYVAFTDAMEQELSAQRHIDNIHAPLVLTHGTLETPEFQRQTNDFYAALKAAGKPAELKIGEGYNHYETEETLSNPYGFMGRAALSLMQLA